MDDDKEGDKFQEHELRAQWHKDRADKFDKKIIEHCNKYGEN